MLGPSKRRSLERGGDSNHSGEIRQREWDGKGIREKEGERERTLVASIHASFEPESEKPEEQIDLTILLQRV